MKMISIIPHFLLTTIAACSVLGQISNPDLEDIPGVGDEESIVYVEPIFENISVHDPSVIKVEDEYYVFGSHLSAAKTKDWMSWERVADIVTPANPLFEDVTEALAETFRWAQTNTLWAADVIQLADGKFYFYYNACRGDSPLSAMGIAVSDAVEGPYEDAGIILKSGMWGRISEDGVNIYDATIHPNVVDPDVFFDEEGKLWMIYGSYSGGIFIMEMDPETGFPLEGHGYGKHLMGGNHQRIEAPYILYSPHTRFYYMFVSYGGLAANGGYSIRVARSETPDGPYLDTEGNDMAIVMSATAFNDAAISPYSAKLMGNYSFTDTYPYFGYVSPGHNSAFYDEGTGQYFLIFHTRFPSTGEVHEVRVHEMFFNEDGWPVVAPLRYAPRIDTSTIEEEAEDDGTEEENSDEDDPNDGIEGDGEVEEPEDPPFYYLDVIDPGSIPGTYKLINHGKDISNRIILSTDIVLHPEGLISGETEGVWTLEEGNDIILDFGESGIFKGVLSRQWNEYLFEFVITFSALSDRGVSIWGVRWDELPERQEVEE